MTRPTNITLEPMPRNLTRGVRRRERNHLLWGSVWCLGAVGGIVLLARHAHNLSDWRMMLVAGAMFFGIPALLTAIELRARAHLLRTFKYGELVSAGEFVDMAAGGNRYITFSYRYTGRAFTESLRCMAGDNPAPVRHDGQVVFGLLVDPEVPQKPVLITDRLMEGQTHE
jgi:hypothetical protein